MIVIGYGRTGARACDELVKSEQQFVLIENDVDLYETLADGAPEEEWNKHLPHTHVMRLSHGSLEPEIWLEDARDLTVWYPRE